MARNIASIPIIAATATLVACALGQPAAASTGKAPSFIPTGGASFPPLGFLNFCRVNPDECKSEAAPATQPPPAPLVNHFETAQWLGSAPAAIQQPADAPRRLMTWGSIQPAGEFEAVGAVVEPPQPRIPSAFGLSWQSRPVMARVLAIMDAQPPASPQPGNEQAALPSPAVASEQPAAADPAIVEASPEMLRLINTVNRDVNGALISRSDMAAGRGIDTWEMPLSQGRNVGDCEDFVLEKRHRLISMGVSRQALTIAIVRTGRGELHAVLVVRTTNGDVVLDSLSAWVTPWRKTGYRWIQRQSSEDPMKWLSVPA